MAIRILSHPCLLCRGPFQSSYLIEEGALVIFGGQKFCFLRQIIIRKYTCEPSWASDQQQRSWKQQQKLRRSQICKKVRTGAEFTRALSPVSLLSSTLCNHLHQGTVSGKCCHSDFYRRCKTVENQSFILGQQLGEIVTGSVWFLGWTCSKERFCVCACTQTHKCNEKN